MPQAISRSASWMASFTHDSPCMPIMPRHSGCDAGNPPMPSSVRATGICARSASVRTCSMAPDSMTPCPAKIIGRLALRISSAASASSASPTCSMGCGRLARGLAASKSKIALLISRILGDVDEHRPGPVAARNLKRMADGRRNVFSAAHQKVVLGHGQRNAGNVHFLKRIGSQQLGRHVAR